MGSKMQLFFGQFQHRLVGGFCCVSVSACREREQLYCNWQRPGQGGRGGGEGAVCKLGLLQLCAARNMTTTASPANPPLASSSSVIPSFPPFLALPGSPHHSLPSSAPSCFPPYTTTVAATAAATTTPSNLSLILNILLHTRCRPKRNLPQKH